MPDAPEFDTLYAGVPADQREALRKFREQHPEHTTTHAGATWLYLVAGDGPQTVLLLVGGLRVADAAYRNIPMLSDTYRVVTPTYPALDTMDTLADGLAAVLDAVGVEAAHVLAGSFGGMLAQVFVRRHPQRAASLILSNTAAPDPAAVDRYRQIAQTVEATPPEHVASLAQPTMFQAIDPPESLHAFYRAYLAELYTQRLDKAAVLSTYHAMIDFNGRSFAPGDLDGWAGRVLVLESDDDATFDAAARARLRDLYPAAQVHTFEGAGHSPGTTQRETYFRVVRDFLMGGSSAG